MLNINIRSASIVSLPELIVMCLFYVIIFQVELRAFCLKHSNLQEDRSILPLGGRSIAAGGDFSEANDLPVSLPVSSEHNVKIVCDNGGLVSNSIPDKLNHNGVPPDDGAFPQHDIGVTGKTNEHVDGSDSLSFVLVLKKVFYSA